MRIVVTRQLHLEGWWARCHVLGIGTGTIGESLTATEISAAQAEALGLVAARLAEFVSAFENATGQRISEGMAPA